MQKHSYIFVLDALISRRTQSHPFFIELESDEQAKMTLSPKWPSGQQLKQQTIDSEQVPKIIACYNNSYITVFLSSTHAVWNEQFDVIEIYSNQLSDHSESIHLSSGTN